jgi:hypothetical protein
LIIRMQETEKLSLGQIRAFLEASGEVQFEGQNRTEVYGWVNSTLRQHDYERMGRSGKGLLRRFLEKMTGYSRAQIARMIAQYQSGAEVQLRPYGRAAVSPALHARRCRTAGASGRSP